MEINYVEKVIPMGDQEFLATVLHEIQNETNIEDKIDKQKKMYKILKERYSIPMDHCISLSYDEYNKDIVVIFDFGNKMTRA